MSDVPEGYRMSEAGVIPEDWEVVKYGDNLSIISGMGFNKSEYVDSGIKLLRIDNVSYGEITWESIAFLPMDYRNKYPNLIIDSDDILLALNRPITNGKLKIAIVEPKDIPCILYQRVGKIIFLNNLCDRKFAYYLLSKFIKKFVEESSVGSDQPFISTTKLKQIAIPLPPLPEQQAIASALSDVDALIAALGQLITKKRNIKQGAMQQLLTGEKRLPGFGGEWGVKRLGEIFRISAGGDYISQLSFTDKDEIHCFPIYSNSITDHGLYGYCSYFVYEANSITVTARGTLGIANFRDHKFTAIGRVLVLQPEYPLDCFYVSEYINNRIDFVVESTGVPQLTAPQISKYEIILPSLLEQQAIAQILSDMDTEIEALQQKRDKYKAIKQGMMQELLTGKTRLV